MKGSLKAHLVKRSSRLKRRAENIAHESAKACLLLGIIMFIAVSLIYLYTFMISSPFFALHQTLVRGCKEVTEKEILSLAATKPAQSILAVNCDAMAARIKMNPWVRFVSIGRELPNRLVIDVRERKAIAILKTDHLFYLLDEGGVAFKKVETADEADLPVLTGYGSGINQNKRLLDRTLALLHLLASANILPAAHRVAEVHGNDTMGLFLFTDHGLCLNLGLDHYDQKLQKLPTVMTDLEKRNVKWAFAVIDFTHPEKVTVQKRKVLEPAEVPAVKKGYKM